MKAIIKFCVSNLVDGAQKAKETLEKDPNLTIMEYECLRHCGICAVTLYALVDHTVVRGSTSEELVENIYTYLDEKVAP